MMKPILIGSFLVLLFCLGFCEIEVDTSEACVHDLNSKSLFSKIPGIRFVGRALKSLVNFKPLEVKVHFYLYKQDFPTCGQLIHIDDDSLQKSSFNASHQTRILINGWMSPSKASFIREVTKAYLSLDDFNIIVVDWTTLSTTINYYKVVGLIEDVGQVVANFSKHMHNTLGVDYDDVYLIGHSLGAQVAGSAGKQIHPDKFNTIFALDPAGPGFRDKGVELRIDSSDANYVESIQTSENMGFLEPVGNATFYPNKGSYQKCIGYGCSHRRAYKFFAESITSTKGFWGTPCDRDQMKKDCPETLTQYKMGGEPSTPKTGIFYVKTKSNSPYAMGKSTQYMYA